MKNKTYWIVGGAIGVGVVGYLILKAHSRSSIVAAKNNALAPTSTAAPYTKIGGSVVGPISGSTTGGAAQGGLTSEPMTPTVINTPGGQISTVQLSFAAPTADALYYAPQNIY